MAGVVLESLDSAEAVMRNLQRLNEAIVAMQGGQIAMENIVGYEDLATKATVEDLEASLEKLKIPVGGRYYSTAGTNPADFFGYGTWELVGAGRVEIGVGQATDSREEKKAFAAGEKAGEFNHQLTEEELANHSHSFNRGHYITGGAAHGGNVWGHTTTKHDLVIQDTGGDKAHNNMQPYEVIYKWQRTA